MNGRGQGGRLGATGGHRGMARGYGSQNQPRDYYDPANERGGGINQNPTSSRLINNALNVASSSNIPSNSGKCLSELSSINKEEHKMSYNNHYIDICLVIHHIIL